MKTSPKPVYRQHDIIEIVEPLVVTRVGYPLGIEDGVREITEKHAKDIHELLVKMGLEREVPKLFDRDPLLFDPGDNGAAFDEIVHCLAYHWIRAKGFGGRTRSIHTTLREDLRGRRARVRSKRIVKTGEYYAPSGGQNYWGEWDYEPGGLTDMKTHVLLNIEPLGNGITLMCAEDEIEIEACHVRHFVEKTEWTDEKSA